MFALTIHAPYANNPKADEALKLKSESFYKSEIKKNVISIIYKLNDGNATERVNIEIFSLYFEEAVQTM